MNATELQLRRQIEDHERKLERIAEILEAMAGTTGPTQHKLFREEIVRKVDALRYGLDEDS